MLKLDFYESGEGETIVLTFPSGGLGIVDAHPSSSTSRQEILQITRGKTIHFVCLTHPHKDHGADLIPILEQHPDIKAFWHTVSDVDVTIFIQQEAMNYPNYPSPCRDAIVRMKKGWAEFLIEIYGAVAKREIPRHQLRSDQRAVIIDGVEVFALAPEESIKDRFVRIHQERLKGKLVDLPDPNLLSAVLAIKYGSTVALLGGDALKENWKSATRQFFNDHNLPKAMILKVPHHGAANALEKRPQAREHNYLDICSHSPRAKSVLFAGDGKHPDREVFQLLRARTDVTCVSNGYKSDVPAKNPLSIMMPGARAVSEPFICNPVVSFEVSLDGTITETAGNCDPKCLALSATA